MVEKATTQQKGPLGPPVSWRSDVVEKATTQQKGPLGPPIEFGDHTSWRSDELETRCWNENMSQRGWAPRPLVEQSRRTRTTHGDARRGWGGQYVAVFVQSPTPSHTHNLSNKVRGIYFSKNCVARLYSLRQYVFCMYMCI